MTSPERRQEAANVSTVFHAALTSLGFKTLAESIQLWADVSVDPAQVASTSGRWITYALSLVGLRRRHARAVTFSYYRLFRALHTGYTIRDLGSEQPAKVPLNRLRRDFYDTLEEYTPEVLGRTGEPDAQPGDELVAEGDTDYTDLPAIEPEGPDELIELEEIAELEEELRLEDEAAEDEARIVLEALGPNNLESKLKAIDEERPTKEVDERRREAHVEAGNRQAAAAARVAMNGGRGMLFGVGQKDERALGWVRASRTGTPCGWCAMLISRGPVYRTAETAGFDEEGDLYHDNCHCFAELVYGDEQYADKRFDLNRRYAKDWPRVTRGLSGKEALSAWRKYIRALQARGA